MFCSREDEFDNVRLYNFDRFLFFADFIHFQQEELPTYKSRTTDCRNCNFITIEATWHLMRNSVESPLARQIEEDTKYELFG